jgi:hypothetical protein
MGLRWILVIDLAKAGLRQVATAKRNHGWRRLREGLRGWRNAVIYLLRLKGIYKVLVYSKTENSVKA